jgi:sec-independent protein translocase protein TatC
MRRISHDDRLTVIDHLGEFRSRLVACLLAFGAALALCFWQNHLILEIVNRPLPGRSEPITFGVTEPFLTTFTNAAYAAILLALPVILYQAYAFVLPAFSPRERRAALPLLLMVPFLFIAGAVFCYFVVLTPATDFLLSFNADQFDVEVRAQDYYGFITLTTLAMGLGFQVPVGVLALVRLEIVSVAQLRKNRRYAVLAIAVLAALLPTLDPVTLIAEMVPLLLLYELGIVLAATFGSASVAEAPAVTGS